MEAFDRERVAAAKHTIWYTGGCNSWYLDAQGIPASWPWTYSRFVAEMTAPIRENFDVSRRSPFSRLASWHATGGKRCK